MSCIILIGMPASGKSTSGVILAKVLGLDYIDVDLLIQHHAGQRLSEIISERGIDGFLALEEEVCLSVTGTEASPVDDEAGSAPGAVIATGGSAVYSDAAMRHLKTLGTVIYLQVDYEPLRRRLRDIRQRGVVLREGQTFRDLYDERKPLYEKYADITIREGEGNVEDSVEKMCRALGQKY